MLCLFTAFILVFLLGTLRSNVGENGALCVLLKTDNITIMAPAVRAEVALVSLKNCLVNLPPGLIALISNTNTVGSLWSQVNSHCLQSFSLPRMLWSNCNIGHKLYPQALCLVEMLLASNDPYMLDGLACLAEPGPAQ